MSRKEDNFMWTKMMALGATTLVALCATSACGSAEEEISLVEETGVAELAAGEFCGGIANIQCPEGSTCIDDPDDSCDPGHGGVDCGGVCIQNEPEGCQIDPAKEYNRLDPAQCAAARFFCPPGSQPFFDECGCGCEVGQVCGSAFCGAGEFCCNESCSICAPEGGVCTQQFCIP